jgi:host factor-I protein
MSVELETGLPSIRLLQNYLRDKRTVEVQLVTGDTVRGILSWQDPNCLCITVEGEPMLVWRSALVSLKAVSE